MMDFKAFQGEEHQPFFWEGGKPAALLVHGFPGTPAEMRPLGELLHQAGWTAQGILLPGFGPAIATLEKQNHSDWTSHILENLRMLQRNHNPVLLIGNSMGGALSIHVATQCVPDGLILFAPFWNINHILWRFLPILKFIFPFIRPFRLLKLDFSDPQVREGIHSFMPDADLNDPQVQQTIRDFRFSVRVFDQIRLVGKSAYHAAPHLSMPVLVIQGIQDDLVTPKMTQILVKRIVSTVHYEQLHAKHDLLDPALSAWTEIQQITHKFIQDFR